MNAQSFPSERGRGLRRATNSLVLLITEMSTRLKMFAAGNNRFTHVLHSDSLVEVQDNAFACVDYIVAVSQMFPRVDASLVPSLPGYSTKVGDAEKIWAMTRSVSFLGYHSFRFYAAHFSRRRTADRINSAVGGVRFRSP